MDWIRLAGWLDGWIVADGSFSFGSIPPWWTNDCWPVAHTIQLYIEIHQCNVINDQSEMWNQNTALALAALAKSIIHRSPSPKSPVPNHQSQ